MTTTDNRMIEVPTCVVPIELMAMVLNVLHEVQEGTGDTPLQSDCIFLERQIEGILIHYNLNGDRVDE